jgi:long-chain fatty acid transport protein
MYSTGLSYKPNSDITLRAGYARDRSPVPNATLRTPRIPDSDRDWITLGMSIHHIPNTTVDFGLAYIHADEVTIDNIVTLGSVILPSDHLSGIVDSNVMIVGAQVQYRF